MNSRKTSNLGPSMGKFLFLDLAKSVAHTERTSLLQSPRSGLYACLLELFAFSLESFPHALVSICCTLSVRIKPYPCLRSNKRDGKASSVLDREQRRLLANRQSIVYKCVKAFPIDSGATHGKTTRAKDRR